VCVVSSGSCEMAQSAIQAVKNLEHTYGIPASKIAVTPMIGMNDATTEIFTTADVNTLTSYASSNGWPGCTSGHWTRHALLRHLCVPHLQLHLQHDTAAIHQSVPERPRVLTKNPQRPRTVARARPAYSSRDVLAPGGKGLFAERLANAGSVAGAAGGTQGRPTRDPFGDGEFLQLVAHLSKLLAQLCPQLPVRLCGPRSAHEGPAPHLL